MPRIDPQRARLIDGVVAQIRGCLPATWQVIRSADGRNAADAPSTDIVRVASPDGRSATVHLAARLSTPSAAEIESAISHAGSAPVVVIAPFLTARTRSALLTLGASYADTTGNLRVVIEDPAVYIERRGADRAPRSDDGSPRTLRSLRGPATARVVRALCDLMPPYGVRQLSVVANVPVATVSRVTALLERDGLVERSADRSITSVDWRSLIEAWARDRPLARATGRISAIEPRGWPALVAKLGRLPRHAVTGSLALAGLPGIEQVAPVSLAIVYVDDPEKAIDTLGLVRVDAGANVWIIAPDDPVAFERGRVTPWPVANASDPTQSGLAVAPTQAAADLLASPGRGPAEADALMRWMEANERVWRIHPGT